MAVVCAYDFSPYSIEALTAAVALTRAADSELRAVHVYDMLGAEVDVEARVERLGKLQKELRRLGVDPTAGRVVTGGGTVDAILRQSGAPDTRLIVIGAHGAGRSSLLGSVAAAVAVKAEVPVLVVRSAAALRDAATRRQELSIDVAFGRDASSAAALNWANGFALRIPAIVRPLRATALGEAVDAGVHHIHVPDRGSLATSVAARAAQSGAGMIVIGHSERRGLARLRRPTVRAMLEHATTNVTCVPPSFVAGTPVL